MNTFTYKFTPQDEKKIKSFFIQKNVKFEPMKYAFWRARNTKFTIIFYTSGKLLMQGSEIDFIIQEFSQFMQISSIYNIIDDKSRIKMDFPLYIGTDESGKGDFFGPLVIAGVLVNEKNKQMFIKAGIKDSKKLTDDKIKKLAYEIKKNSIFSIVTIKNEKYNELYDKFKNLNKLLAWGHARVIENILEKAPTCQNALSDKFGDENLIKNALLQKGKNINLQQQIRAEEDIAVACASVIARAEFVEKINSLKYKYYLDFSKGASDKVIQQAKLFVQKYSRERLNEVAKLHFKTINSL